MDFSTFCKRYKLTKNELFSEFFEVFKDTFEVKNKNLAIKKLQKIMTATFKLSASQGFANMTLRQLSQETQISMGGLYAYIKNKQQLSLFIHQFLNEYASKVFSEIEQKYPQDEPVAELDSVIRVHVYLSEILRPWFFFAFMESKNLDKKLRKYAIASELSVESKLIKIIEKGQKNGVFHQLLSAETVATHIKPLLHDWYLKRWKYQQRNTSVDEFCHSIMTFVNHGLTQVD